MSIVHVASRTVTIVFAASAALAACELADAGGAGEGEGEGEGAGEGEGEGEGEGAGEGEGEGAAEGEGEGAGEGEGEGNPCEVSADCAPGLECAALDGAEATCVAPGGIDAPCDPGGPGDDDGCDDALTCPNADPPLCSCNGAEDCAPGDVCFLQTSLLGDSCRNTCQPPPGLDEVCAFFQEDECIADGAACTDGLECIGRGDIRFCNVPCDPTAAPDPCAPDAECMTNGACRALEGNEFCNPNDPPEHDGCVAPLVCNSVSINCESP